MNRGTALLAGLATIVVASAAALLIHLALGLFPW